MSSCLMEWKEPLLDLLTLLGFEGLLGGPSWGGEPDGSRFTDGLLRGVDGSRLIEGLLELREPLPGRDLYKEDALVPLP